MNVSQTFNVLGVGQNKMPKWAKPACQTQLEPKHNIDSRFAFHWFKSARMIYHFWAYSHGLTEDRLRLYFDNFCEVPVSPPSLDEQRHIADLLDSWYRDRSDGSPHRRKETAEDRHHLPPVFWPNRMLSAD